MPLHNSQLLYSVRIAQAIVALPYIVLVCYSSVHRGYWTDLNRPLICGIITALVTFAWALQGVLVHYRDMLSIAKLGFIGRLLADSILTVLWIISVLFMLMHKGKDFRKAFLAVPKITWGVAVGLAIIEVVLFLQSIYFVARERRVNRSLPGGLTAGYT